MRTLGSYEMISSFVHPAECSNPPKGEPPESLDYLDLLLLVNPRQSLNRLLIIIPDTTTVILESTVRPTHF
jgi:hypothetical protein